VLGVAIVSTRPPSNISQGGVNMCFEKGTVVTHGNGVRAAATGHNKGHGRFGSTLPF
jgi:hypothetical protein